MVLIHLKRTEEHQFLYEAPAATPVAELTAALAALYNARLRLSRLCAEGAELASFGPMRPPEQQGLDAGLEGLRLTELDADGQPLRGDADAAARDPSGRRCGAPPPAPAQRTLRRTLDDAAAAIHKRQVEAKVPLTAALVGEHTELVRAAVTICWPEGLPDWDPISWELAGEAPEAKSAQGKEVVDASGASLWGPGAKLLVDKGPLLSHSCGRNEKTRVLLRLQAAGEGAPQREVTTSAEEQAAMLAFYRKKQAEAAALAAADEGDCASSAWANPRALKASIAGVADVRLGGRGSSGFNQGRM